MAERTLYPSPAIEDARAVWRIADGLRADASRLRHEADTLDSQAIRLDRVAAAIADGRDVSEALG